MKLSERRKLWHAVLGLVLFVIGAGAGQEVESDAPAVFLHLTDIHVSTNAEKYWPEFGDREGDLTTFAKNLIPRIQPGGVIITGDLTDSKDRHGAGLQAEAEWQGYRALLSAFEAAGVPAANILDLRGNHDGFGRVDPRGGASDHFARYSASGPRGDSVRRRVWSHVLLPQHAVQQANETLRPLLAWEADRVLVRGRPRACPAAVLMGVDFSQGPGLKNPINFFGQADASLTREIQVEVAAIKAAWPKRCRSLPPIIAYGHYPLGAVDYHPAGEYSHLGPLGALLHAAASTSSVQGAAAALATAPAAAYLSGHLHTVFGERLHRLHASRNPETKRAYMAELESGAWKDDRRFRIAAVDGGALSFADLYFWTPTAAPQPQRADAAAGKDGAWLRAYDRRGWGVTAADKSGRVIDHVAMVTWPPDARYSPQATTVFTKHRQGVIRALVFPLSPEAAAENGVDVELAVYLADGTKLMHGEMGADGVVVVDDTNRGGPRLFTASPRITVFCAAAGGADGTATKAATCVPPAKFAMLKITVRSVTGAISTSVDTPVALKCRKSLLGQGRQECWVAPSETPAPMGSTWTEWFVLLVNWPVLMHKVLWVGWLGYVGLLLLLPRKLAMDEAVCRRILASPMFRSPSSMAGTTAGGRMPLSNRSPVRHSAPMATAFTAGDSKGMAAALWHRVAPVVAWPFAALVLCAGLDEVWVPLVGYACYLMCGPLYLAELLDGTPPAAIMAYGVWGSFNEGWQFFATPDTFVQAILHIAVCVAPLTLWVACVVGKHVLERRRVAPHSASVAGGTEPERHSLITAPQALAIVLIGVVNYKFGYTKNWATMGPLTVLVSPGQAWAVPLAVVLVAATARRAGRRFGALCSKGE